MRRIGPLLMGTLFLFAGCVGTKPNAQRVVAEARACPQCYLVKERQFVGTSKVYKSRRKIYRTVWVWKCATCDASAPAADDAPSPCRCRER